jgi:peptide methionine sulfoxide reductase msrA/msrB
VCFKSFFLKKGKYKSIFVLLITEIIIMAQQYNELTDEEKRIIENKGTEQAFTGKYYDFNENGVYICKKCNASLFQSESKFNSGSGWPSFDTAMRGAVKEIPDKDGMRIEIVCANCGGHLGHVFRGEGFTNTNMRHCVNSASLDFFLKEEIAIFAGGCFWGVEYLIGKQEGVKFITSGYIGGQTENPTYEEVSYKKTGHAEAVKVIFDSKKISYEKLAKLFFEIHDPTQLNRQGPDIGEQYRSEIFYLNKKQKETAENLIKILKEKGFEVVTKVTKAGKFTDAEDYHQNYYDQKGKIPYCHKYEKKF